MNKVKATILKNLQHALVECNMAGAGENDLDPILSRQHSAYGHISEAIREIGGDEMIDYWIENGCFEEES